ncbi:hypothetical protein CgunFtcFv8_001176 [Champsocephalus gunnari]|uniref:Uncharacterized protein n=1 Tax=Champsocephalus gunnari TaxID=52237 RepID=A0AAN8HQV4_CHAGU|nr:hypothetical protein CgunFtcFv8_001176 [Champsocephalus gunnari]
MSVISPGLDPPFPAAAAAASSRCFYRLPARCSSPCLMSLGPDAASLLEDSHCHSISTTGPSAGEKPRKTRVNQSAASVRTREPITALVAFE